MGDEGLETRDASSCDTNDLRKVQEPGAAKSEAKTCNSVPIDPELAEVVAAWDGLLPPIKAAILGLARG